MLQTYTITEQKFIEMFDIQEDKSETAYFTGTMQPDIDKHLMDLILLFTRELFMIPPSTTVQELKENILIEFMGMYSDDLKEKIQRIFNPWRF